MTRSTKKSDKSAMARLRWAAYEMRRTVGQSGLVAGAVLLAAMVADFGYMQPKVAALHEERDAVTQALVDMPNLRLHEGKPGVTLRDVQQLRSDDQAYSVLELLKHHHMQGLQASYSQKVEAKGKLRRVTIDISMTGDYVGLRQAMRDIGNQPMSRIESVSVDRDHIDRGQINARLRVSLLGPDR